LILDEATSALDAVNEKMVQRALDDLVVTTKATALTIAHRLTTVKDCDRIFVFNEGRLVEKGTHEELLEASTEYRNMVAAQTARSERTHDAKTKQDNRE
jgi:ABC-type multidrug transport system fused ATPase/permease subunit